MKIDVGRLRVLEFSVGLVYGSAEVELARWVEAMHHELALLDQE
jgi:hypothetical protein